MARQNILQRTRIKKACALLEANQLPQAAELLGQLARSDRRNADVWQLLGVVAGKQNRHADAADHFRQALQLRPGDLQLLYNYAISMRNSGSVEEALEVFRRIFDAQPGFRDVAACLADACLNSGRLAESADVLRTAVGVQPGNAELHANLGSVLQALGRVDEAVACYRTALNINPDYPAYDSYGSALTSQGNFQAALAVYREGLARQPGNARVHSNLLLTLNYMPELTPEEIFREHCDWGMRQGARPGKAPPHDNRCDPDRRLRIGYVSPDFRTHSVAYYFEPLLASHHREDVEVFCYSTLPRPDTMTGHLRALADHWRDIHGRTDQQVAAQIRADGIDILVDLAGHTAHNSLAVFALKPAPLQVTWLGYPNTTGLPAMDYRLTDAVADPVGDERYYTEQLVRLPDCFLCYQPMSGTPPVGALPAAASGHVTFGSFNNLAKINPGVVELWSAVLDAVPASRLLVKNRSLTDTERRTQYRQMFRECGISDERVELLGHTPTREEHLALYGRVDIGLDTFPYNGTTTTCEALWMGVPVLVLAGDRHAGRVGQSLLHCVGLDTWVAGNSRQFVEKAVALSADHAALALLRGSLRERLANSPLCDGEAFARKVEDAYRWMWRQWCESRSP